MGRQLEADSQREVPIKTPSAAVYAQEMRLRNEIAEHNQHIYAENLVAATLYAHARAHRKTADGHKAEVVRLKVRLDHLLSLHPQQRSAPS